MASKTKEMKRKAGDEDSSSAKKLSKSGLKTDCRESSSAKSGSSDKKKSIISGAFEWSSPQPDLYVCKYLGGGQSSSFIASFDLDWTLVATKTDSPFPKDENDFKILDEKIPKLIAKYVEEGHRFVIFSNQGGVTQNKVTLDEIKKRIENILKSLDPKGKLPCLVLVATGDDLNRKPRPGMWWMLERVYNADVQINRCQSFYVGDAAGRVYPADDKKSTDKKSAGKKTGSKSKPKKDFSAFDLTFARNLNLSFLTPEQFISATPDDLIDVAEENAESMTINAFDPKANIATEFGKELIRDQVMKDEEAFKEMMKTLPEKKPIVVVMTGLPGSGKTRLYERYFKDANYVKISRDELGTADKCEKMAEKYLKEGGVNIVVDNTSVDVASRKKWINLCKPYDCTFVSIAIVLDVKRALHNNLFRRCIQFDHIYGVTKDGVTENGDAGKGGAKNLDAKIQTLRRERKLMKSNQCPLW